MRYKIASKISVVRDLKKISREQVRSVLKTIEEELPERANSLPPLPGKFSSLRTLRVGDFKVIYTIIEDTALIVRISHQRELHK